MQQQQARGDNPSLEHDVFWNIVPLAAAKSINTIFRIKVTILVLIAEVPS